MQLCRPPLPSRTWSCRTTRSAALLRLYHLSDNRLWESLDNCTMGDLCEQAPARSPKRLAHALKVLGSQVYLLPCMP